MTHGKVALINSLWDQFIFVVAGWLFNYSHIVRVIRFVIILIVGIHHWTLDQIRHWHVIIIIIVLTIRTTRPLSSIFGLPTSGKQSHIVSLQLGKLDMVPLVKLNRVLEKGLLALH